MTVLHEWRFAGYVCRIVETEPGIVHFEQAQGPPIGIEATIPLAFNRTEKPLGCANEIIHLSQTLAEANVINRDLSKAIQGWQEDRNRRERGKDIHTLTCALESERLRAENAEADIQLITAPAESTGAVFLAMGAERDRLKGELAEAEEAINDAAALLKASVTIPSMLKRWQLQPAVRRARERGK